MESTDFEPVMRKRNAMQKERTSRVSWSFAGAFLMIAPPNIPPRTIRVYDTIRTLVESCTILLQPPILREGVHMK